MKIILNLYNIKKFKNTINLYGFKYSYKDYFIEVVLIILTVLGLSYAYHLNKEFMCLILIFVLFMMPWLISAYYKTKYNIKRFNELNDYLSNAIPIFINKPKIIYTLKELKELTSGEINSKITKAIDYIEKTVNDPKLFSNGLKIISDSFNNSRLISLHHFMIEVENGDSNNFQLLADCLYMDIENWIKRACLNEKELLDRRNKLIILSLSSLVINGLFIYVYQSEELFNGFTTNIYFQLSESIFIILIFLIITICLSSLSLKGMVDDQKLTNEKELSKAYVSYQDGVKQNVIQIITSIILGLGGAYLYYLKYSDYALMCWLLAIIGINLNRIHFIKAKNKLKEYYTLTFPLWLREISLSVGNLTVLNSITNSLKKYEYPLRKELNKFLTEANKNPLSIKPYNDFLNEHEIDGVRSSMRILFSLNNFSKDNVKERLSFLTQRNQELLAKSESIQNRNTLAMLEMLGFIPIILFTAETIVSMGLMFTYIINNLGGGLI